MYGKFNLTLMVNHACNLRCSYCYTGKKFFRAMPDEVAEHAIDRAVASLQPGGALELGFFGGEPLLEAERVARLLDYAALRTEQAGMRLCTGLTTNGTITIPAAWSLMLRPCLDLAVSHDGLPEVHDEHRRLANGRPSSGLVLVTLRTLIAMQKEFHVVMVVRPDTVGSLPEGVRYLRELGVRHIEPALDLWAHWTPPDLHRLETAVIALAHVWRDGLPGNSISWFDEKAARLMHLPVGDTARCGFGCGQIAVAPSGRLYPCERLIGADEPDNPMCMPGDVRADRSFRHFTAQPARAVAACAACKIRAVCSTTCRAGAATLCVLRTWTGPTGCYVSSINFVCARPCGCCGNCSASVRAPR